MPIKRCADQLARCGKHEEYMSLLVNHFNQMLELPIAGRRRTLCKIMGC